MPTVRFRRPILILPLLLFLLSSLALFPAKSEAGLGTTVFINEIHYDNTGTDSGEAVEIAGPAGLDLSGWSLVLYNGNTGSSYDTIALSGVIPDQDGGFGTLSFSVPGLQNGSPDGIALVDNGTVVQLLSYEGAFTTNNGPAAGQQTQDIGVSEASSSPVGNSLQLTGSGTIYEDFTWASSSPNTFGAVNTDQSFGGGGGDPFVQISEIRIDQPGGDDDEYFELSGDPGASLAGLTYLVIGDGAFADGSGVLEAVIDLSGNSLDSNGFFVVAESTFTLGTANLNTTVQFENSDNVTHLLVRDFSGANGDDLDTDDDGVLDSQPWSEIVDLIALVEEANPPSSTEFHYGPPQIGPDGSFVPGHVFRCDEGWVIGEFDPGAGDDTPGAANACGGGSGQLGACQDPATLISTIQGSGSTSPEVGNEHVIEGIVVGDFQNTSNGLSGFFLQEESSDQDGSVDTSEGIFVYDNGFGTEVVEGETVRVLGSVSEFFGWTQISVSDLAVCSSGTVPAPTPVTLPVVDALGLERYEGMLITFPQTLFVTGNFTQGRYGEVDLAVGGRLFNPTNEVEPGPAALALQDQNDARRLQLEDGSRVENPLTLPYFEEGNTLRAGDTIDNLTGVLAYSFSNYELHPTQPVDFTRVNERTTSPDDVGGSLTVASMNVLNYFTTLDEGNNTCGPNNLGCRGADTQEEFERQRAKILAALSAIDADIVGLVEIENDQGTAIADLVSGLNDILGAGTYAYVDTGFIGTDAIKVGLIYKPASVSPVGSFAVLDSTVDPRFIDTKNRPVLAQTFEDGNGEQVTVAVNHLKSKGSDCDDLGDPDANDGQGNCNGTRTAAAEAMVDWLAGNPTGSDDPDILIIGDLNAYAMEDPVDAIEEGTDDVAGSPDDYTDLIETFVGPDAYSYVFAGQAGYLDHALGTRSLTAQVTGVTVWHINADEPSALDYNNYNQDPLYSPDPYRSSDHDPVIVGLDLDSATTVTIVKDSRPDSRRNFGFEGDLGRFILDDPGYDDGDSFSNAARFEVEPGGYAVFERTRRHWLLTDIRCEGGNTSSDLSVAGVKIDAGSGEDITCTFVNQFESRIWVVKYNDRNADGNWRRDKGLKDWTIQLYDDQGALVAEETTNGSGKARFRGIVAGEYKVCEVQQDGWFNTAPGTTDPVLGQPCYDLTVEPAEWWLVFFGNSRNPQAESASAVSFPDALPIEDEVLESEEDLMAARDEEWLAAPFYSELLYLPSIAGGR